MFRYQATIWLLVVILVPRTVPAESSDSSSTWNHSDLPREITDEDEAVGVSESVSNHKWFQNDSSSNSRTNASLYADDAFERVVNSNRSSLSDEVKPANVTNGRSGRELDLDALLTGSVKHHEPGERESRILNDSPTGIALQGFIPVLGLGAAAAAGAAALSSASSNSQHHHHHLVQQSFQKHASYVPYHHQPQLPSFAKQSGSAISHRLQALASSLSPINKLNRRRQQQPTLSTAFGQPQTVDYAQFAQQCTCVPFYMCKAGYIEQERSNQAAAQYGPIMRMHPSSDSIQASASLQSSSLQSSQLASALLTQAEQYQLQQQFQQQQQQQQQQRAPSAASSSITNIDSSSLQSMYGDSNLESSSSNTNPDLELPIDERSVDGSDKTHFNSESMFNQSDIEVLGRMLGFGGSGANNPNSVLSKFSNQCGVLRTCCPLLSASEVITAQQYSQSTGSNQMNQFAPSVHSIDNSYASSQAAIVNPYPSASSSATSNHQLSPNFVPYSSPLQPPTGSVLPSPYGFPTRPSEFYASQSKPIATHPNHHHYHHHHHNQQSQFQHRQRASSFSYVPEPAIASAMQLNRWQLDQTQPQAQCGVRPDVGQNHARVLNSPNAAAGSTEFGEFPWQAALLKRLGPADSLFVCGATLISQDWVATAAHCIKKNTADQLKVRLGEYDVHRDDEYYPHVERNVAEIIKHPQFYPGTLANDIALLRLMPISPQDPQSARPTPHIVPICLPYPGENFANQRCWVAGWGKDAFGPKGDYQSVLRKVDVPVIGHSQCNARLRQTRLGPLFDLHAGFMCAGGEPGKDACEGDGGSALVCEVNGVWKAAGLVSWGLGCGKAGLPGVYVNVGHYSRWIDHVMSSSNTPTIDHLQQLGAAAHVHVHSHPINHGVDLSAFQRQSTSSMDERGTSMNVMLDPASIINERSNSGPGDELSLDSGVTTNQTTSVTTPVTTSSSASQ